MHLLRLLICAAALAVVASAGPVGLVDLNRVLDRSSIVVVASVAEGGQAGTTASVVLEVLRTLKGSIGAGVLTAEISVSSEFAARRPLAGLQAIWFLAADGPGAYRVLPAMVGSVPLEHTLLPALKELPSSWAPPASATPLEKLLRELAASVEAKGDSLAGLTSEYLCQVPAAPASSLSGLYRRMLSSSAPAVSSAGLAGLIRSGDVEGLATLKSKLSQRAEIQAARPLAQAVCEYYDGDAGGLAILAEFASRWQPILRLRECAAFALRNIHSRESIPFLVALLDSDQDGIRYEAMAGLASYANSGYIPHEKPLTVNGVSQPRQRSALRTAETEAHFPTLDTFRKDQNRFITFWKQWSLANAAAITKP